MEDWTAYQQLNIEKEALYKALQDCNSSVVGEKCSKIIQATRSIVAQLGIDPECPNCDGTGGAHPSGACGMCWIWRGDA